MRKILLILFFSCVLQLGLYSQSTNKQWVLSTAQGTELYAQSWATRTSFPQEFIKEQWNNGKYITSLSYGGGLWAAVMSKGAPIQKQTWATRQVFPQDLIKSRWEEGFSVTEVNYGQSTWAFVFSKSPVSGSQTYKLSAGFPGEFIKAHWDDNFTISDITYGQGQWLVLMSKANTGKKQSFIKSRQFPEDWVSEKLKQDYEITEMAFGDGYWVVLASQEGQFDCTINSNNAFPKNEISLAWAKDRAITATAFGYLPNEEVLLIKPEVQEALVVSNHGNGHFNPNPDGRPSLRLVCVMDTKDRLLGLGARHALEAIKDQFSAAAQSVGLAYQATILSEGDFKKENLTKALDNIQAGPEDVLVFYYFGHGFRYSNDSSRFPNCFVGKNGIDHPNEVAFPLTEIYQNLQRKKARLTLVFAECCNNEIGVPAPIDSYIASRPMSVNQSSKDRYKSLFLNQEGSILLASSDEGQASWATTTGGYFLDSFLDAFQYHVSATNKVPASWKTLLEDTQLRVRKLAKAKNRIQEPIFSVQLN